MLISVSVLIFIALLFFVFKFKADIEKSFHEPKQTAKVSPIRIICGDCSGEDLAIPILTLLSVNGTCMNCDGLSYVLASDIGLIIEMRRRERVSAYDAMIANERRTDEIFVNPASGDNQSNKKAQNTRLN